MDFLRIPPSSPDPVAAARPGAVSILRPSARHLLATKTYSLGPDGRVTRREYSLAKQFRLEVAELRGLADLEALLRELEADPRALVIRGAPKRDTLWTGTRRTSTGAAATFSDVPRSWVLVDLDRVPLPAGCSVLGDPAEVARGLVEWLGDLVPELEGASAVVHLSSSAGIAEAAEAERVAGLPARWPAGDPGKVSAHCWFWLTAPCDGAALARWAARINADLPARIVDPAPLRAVQPHYTAAPVFGAGLRDPLEGRRLHLVRGDRDAVTLEVPAPAPRVVLPAGGFAGIGLGFAARLEAIGRPGFHAEINAAVASFVAQNWPHPDADALVALLRQKILEADPGGRSAAQIARYADPDALRARIAWTMERHAEKVAAETEAQREAEAIGPTFPDRGVTLEEAQALADATVAGFAARVATGETPEIMLRVTVGAGKTAAAVRGLPAILEAMRQRMKLLPGDAAEFGALMDRLGAGSLEDVPAGFRDFVAKASRLVAKAEDAGGGRIKRPEPGPVALLVPRHDLGDELAADIRAAHPRLRVAVWRGREADNPARPGEKMCGDFELPRAAAAAGVSAGDVCKACPLAAGCAYQAQRALAAPAPDVWLAAHQVAFMEAPKPLQSASAVILDEAWWPAALRGVDGRPIQLALSALEGADTGHLWGGDRERLLYLRHLALKAIQANGPGLLRRQVFADAGLTAEMAGEWRALEWALKPRPRLAEGMDRAGILEALEGARGPFTPLRPRLAGLLEALLQGDAHSSVNLELIPDADLGRGQGSGPAVRMAWREDWAAWCADLPRLHLDATTAPEVLRQWSPALEVADIEVSAPQQIVGQVTGREFGRAFFTANPGNVARLADLVVRELAEEAGGVLVVTQAAAEELLRPELERRLGGSLPERLHLAHHGALTGLNQWQDVARVLVVGRPALNRLKGERLAEIVKGGPVAREAEGEQAQWQRQRAALRMADGTGRGIARQPWHPDPLVEALRWSITEGAVLQAIGRGRGVRRPVRVLVLGELALPLTVSLQTTWEQALPDRLEAAAAEAALTGRALPLAPADLAAARPDLWASPKAAERFLEDQSKTPQALIRGLYKGSGGFASQTACRYRKRKTGGRWSLGLVPLEGGEEALRALVGPLAAFELTPPDALAPPAPAELEAPPHDEAPAEAELEEELRPDGLVVMGEAPPFALPPPPAAAPPRAAPGAAAPAAVPAVPLPARRDALALLALRLDRVKPPRLLADGWDPLREGAWRDRCERERLRHAPPPAELEARQA